ncbi:ATP-grasp domain-containing protein [Amycolatopsis sp. cmx-11-32]|uniref:ATP-grasp domain-containing protein n=1 Tax=Amycolatopsis sp. cmx-11-32 TaxID=2785796 RepID=UPI0039E32341
MSEVVLLLESNTTGTGRDFARRAAELGARPLVVTHDPGRYPYLAADKVEHIVADTANPAEVETIARNLDAVARIAAVTTSSEYYVPSAAAIAKLIGRPGPDPQAVTACRDKGTQRAVLRSAGVQVPDFELVRTVADAGEAARRVGFPVVVKPVQGSGSLGVRQCPDEESVTKHASRLLAKMTNERGLAVPPEILVESEVPGLEYSVETFDGEVISVVRKHLGSRPQFVELGHDVPARITESEVDILNRVALDALRALGLGWGAAHTEIRLADGQAWLIEVNPRLAGGRIPDLVRLSTGVDLVRAQVAAALGLAERPRAAAHTGASIRFLTAATASVVTATESALAAVKAVPGVVDAVVYRATGDLIGPAADFRDRCGHVTAVAGPHGTAAAAAEQGLARMAAVLGPAGNGGTR